MPLLKDTDFFKTIKQGSHFPVYFLFGQESYFVKKARDMIVDLTLPDEAKSFNLVSFDFEKGEKVDLNALIDAVESFPMPVISMGFGNSENKKCVVVKNCDFDKLLKADFEKMLSLVSDMEQNDTTVLIFCQTSAMVDLKKSAKYKQLEKAVSSIGISCEFPIKDNLTLKRALCEKAKKERVLMDMSSAELLISRCSKSYSILENELCKLIAYATAVGAKQGGYLGEITPALIEECSIPSIEASAFDLAKLLLKGRFDEAFLKLSDLFFLRQEAVAIVFALSMAFADIYRASCAVSAKKSIDEVCADFNYPKNRTFAIKNAFYDARSFSKKQIHSCINALYEADLQLKSSRLDSRLVLEQMIGKIILSSINDR